MAYGIIHRFKGGTKAQYDAVRKAVHPDGGKGLPPGQTHHAAGETSDGFVVTAIWDSKASCDTFMKDTLGPALGSLGDKGLPGPPDATTFEVHNEMKA